MLDTFTISPNWQKFYQFGYTDLNGSVDIYNYNAFTGLATGLNGNAPEVETISSIKNTTKPIVLPSVFASKLQLAF